MFVYTVTKKRAVRLLLVALAVIAGIIIGIAAILTSIKTGADERKHPIYQVDRDDNKVALTFNCAWGNSNTDELLAILEKENVKATFFVTGEFCDKYAEDVLKIFKAGHEVQSHSDKHPHVEGANINDFINDTREVEKKINTITGVAPTLYRAPYGEYDNNSIFTINGMGYKYIQWSVDSIDWQEPDAKTIIKRVTGDTESGSILLFHNDLENTTEALPDVISKLKEKGFDLVKVSDLIYWENYRIDNNGKQVFDNTAEVEIHTAGTQLNSIFEILLENLTIEEIISLENGLSPELTEKLSSILTPTQFTAIAALSEDELKAAWSALVEAKVTQGQMGSIEMESQGTGTTATSAFDDSKLPNQDDKYVASTSSANASATAAGNQATGTTAVTTPPATSGVSTSSGTSASGTATSTAPPTLAGNSNSDFPILEGNKG